MASFCLILSSSKCSSFSFIIFGLFYNFHFFSCYRPSFLWLFKAFSNYSWSFVSNIKIYECIISLSISFNLLSFEPVSASLRVSPNFWIAPLIIKWGCRPYHMFAGFLNRLVDFMLTRLLSSMEHYTKTLYCMVHNNTTNN